MRLLILVLTLPADPHGGIRRPDYDGLVRPDAPVGAGRESGFIYHPREGQPDAVGRANASGHLSRSARSVHPLVILLPSAALLGMAVSLTCRQLQKYL